MGYVEETLLPGETVVHRTRLHWTVLAGPALAGSVFVALAAVAVIAAVARAESRAILAVAAAILMAVAAALVVTATVKRNATEMVVTNRRVLIKKGILRRDTLELFISKIESVVVNESFLGRVFGYGTVVVRGTGGTPEVFERVSRPIEFRRQIQSQIEAIPAPPVATPTYSR